jgi:hypothetical protein
MVSEPKRKEAAMRLLKTENRKISVDELNIADSYQRTIVPARVNRIAKSLDHDSFGSLTVGQRRDGTYWVVDGMQRLTAARKLGIAMVPCDVFQSEGQEHEARVFRLKNRERTNVTACALFRAQLVEGDAQTVDIAETVKAAGLSLRFENGKPGWPFVKAVVSLEKAYRKVGKDGLAAVLSIICESWFGESEALRGDIISGLAYFIHKTPSFDKSRLVSKLADKPISALIRAADATFKLERDRAASSSDRSFAMCMAIECIYSKGLRKKRQAV